MASFRSLLPRGLYGRAALILIVPIVTIQLVVSYAFIQRHFDRVTQALTAAVVIDLSLVAETLARTPAAGRAAALAALERPLQMQLALPAPADAPAADRMDWTDLTGGVVLASLREGLPDLRAADLVALPGRVQLVLDTPEGALMATLSRGRLSPSNPHQLLVIMLVTSVLMTVISYAFLRNQLVPIQRLAAAAEAFGKGQSVPYRLRGALEVRAAGAAFLDMRARIERQIEQRTLLLSGVSHDLRTPLTRLRLALSMAADEEEAALMLADVRQMERLVDEFLAFARGDAMEETAETDPATLARALVSRLAAEGLPVAEGRIDGRARVRMRAEAVGRALENLARNAARFGSRVQIGCSIEPAQVRFTVEDDGPGIPRDRRDEALRPFTRLDTARDPNHGGGVGLGLSIAADVARSHGGRLVLGESAALGGLRADLMLAR